MPALVTLNDYKAFVGIPASNTQYDAQISAIIPVVSDALLTYTGRDFAAPLVTETRTYEYDGSGYLDIDDAAAVTEVAMTWPNSSPLVLTTDQWRAMPQRRDDSPVYYYILMPGFYGGIDGEMGFTYNLDVLMREGRFMGLPPLVDVTAQWGWPVVPESVKLAAYWTLAEWIGRESEGLTSESIESYARSWQRAGGGLAAAPAIPSRALDLLAYWIKPNV